MTRHTQQRKSQSEAAIMAVNGMGLCAAPCAKRIEVNGADPMGVPAF